jgi:hypothetical protein
MNARRLLGASLVLSILAAVAGLLGGGGAGCGGGVDVWYCFSPDGGIIGNEPTSDPSPRPSTCPCALAGPPGQHYPQGDCAWLDAGAEGGPIPGCNGQCVAGPTGGGWSLVLGWFGTESEPPACPLNAPELTYEGWAGLVSTPLMCPTCSCTPSSGSCALPDTITTSASPCADAGAPIAFGGPPGWDGGCAASEATAAAESVTAGPLAVVGETGCTAVSTEPPQQHDPKGTWSVYGISCSTNATGTCPSLSDTCAPAAPAPFLLCIFLYGSDVACPDVGLFTEKHTLYTGSTGEQSCAPCTCASEPGTCSATLSVYSDSACGAGALVASETLGSAMPLCFGIDDAPLGSKAIGPATYTGGACTPDGGPMGEIVPTEPSTYCCIPSP